MKQCKKCQKVLPDSEFRNQKASSDGLYPWCKTCYTMYIKNIEQQKKDIPKYKFCSKCGVTKHNIDFYRDSKRRDGLRSYCKKCDNNLNKKFFNENRDKKLKQNREWGRKNKDKKTEKAASPVKFNDKAKNRILITKYEKTKESKDGFLLIPCAYCGEWIKATRQQIANRMAAINGSAPGENRIYCSDVCKKACPIYWTSSRPKTQQPITSREVSPHLRQEVFKRDQYTCQKCGQHKDTLNESIHCHHIFPIINNPIEAEDINNCITLCATCHQKVHKIPGCTFNELKCLN